MKKYQNIAGIAGIIGLILGIAIPSVAMLIYNWNCPFGDGFLAIIGFVVVSGFVSAVVFGNLVGIILIGILRLYSYFRQKDGG